MSNKIHYEILKRSIAETLHYHAYFFGLRLMLNLKHESFRRRKRLLPTTQPFRHYKSIMIPFLEHTIIPLLFHVSDSLRHVGNLNLVL